MLRLALQLTERLLHSSTAEEGDVGSGYREFEAEVRSFDLVYVYIHVPSIHN